MCPARSLNPAIAARYLFMADVKKRLGCSREVIRRLVKNGELTQVTREGRLCFPREPTELAIAKILAKEGEKETLSPGDREARAIAMIRAGHPPGDVVEAMRMPLEKVETLRRSLGRPDPAPAAATLERTTPTAAEWSRKRAEKRAAFYETIDPTERKAWR